MSAELEPYESEGRSFAETAIVYVLQRLDVPTWFKVGRTVNDDAQLRLTNYIKQHELPGIWRIAQEQKWLRGLDLWMEHEVHDRLSDFIVPLATNAREVFIVDTERFWAMFKDCTEHVTAQVEERLGWAAKQNEFERLIRHRDYKVADLEKRLADLERASEEQARLIARLSERPA